MNTITTVQYSTVLYYTILYYTILWTPGYSSLVQYGKILKTDYDNSEIIVIINSTVYNYVVYIIYFIPSTKK